MYVGHVSPDGRIQLLSDHLHNVAEYCKSYASAFGAEELAYTIGLCHDIGKYSVAFQKRLLNNGPKVDHSTAGAIEIFRVCDIMGAYCVAGHHGGLPDGGNRKAHTAGESTLNGRIKKKLAKIFLIIQRFLMK